MCTDFQSKELDETRGDHQCAHEEKDQLDGNEIEIPTKKIFLHEHSMLFKR